MDRIDLPYVVNTDASLSDVLVLLKKKNCAGVVVKLPSGLEVIELDLILRTLRRDGDVKIGQVKPRARTIRLESDPAAEMALAPDARVDIEDQMDDKGAVYAVAAVAGDVAEVLTRHEYYGHMLRSLPTLYRCTANRRHVWRTEQLAPGNKCRNEGSPVTAI